MKKSKAGGDCGCGGGAPGGRQDAEALRAATRRGFRVDVQGRRIELDEPQGTRGSPSAAAEAPPELGVSASWTPTPMRSADEEFAGAPEPWRQVGALPGPDSPAVNPAVDGPTERRSRRAGVPIGARPSVTPREVLPVRLVPQITFGEGAPTILLECARQVRSNPPYLMPHQDARMLEARWLTECAARKGRSPNGEMYLVLPDGRFHLVPPGFPTHVAPWNPGIPPPPTLLPIPGLPIAPPNAPAPIPVYPPWVGVPPPLPPGSPPPAVPPPNWRPLNPWQPWPGAPGGPPPPPGYIGPSATSSGSVDAAAGDETSSDSTT